MQMLSKNKITPSIMGLYMKRLAGSIQDEDLPLHFIPFDCGEMDYAAPFGED